MGLSEEKKRELRAQRKANMERSEKKEQNTFVTALDADLKELQEKKEKTKMKTIKSSKKQTPSKKEKKGVKFTTTISLLVEYDDYQFLDHYCEEAGISKNAFIKQLIADFRERNDI